MSTKFTKIRSGPLVPISQVGAFGRNDADVLDLYRMGGLGDLMFLAQAVKRLKQEQPARRVLLNTLDQCLPLASIIGCDEARELTYRSAPGQVRPYGDGLNLNWTVEEAADAYWTDRVTLFERFCGLEPNGEPLQIERVTGGRERVEAHRDFDAAKPVLLFAPLQGHGGGTRSLPWTVIRKLLPLLKCEYNVVYATPNPAPPAQVSWRGTLTFCGTTTDEFAALCGGADRCLGVDSGGTYLAAAQSVPTVAVYEHVAPWLRMGRIPTITALWVRDVDCRCEHHGLCSRGEWSPEAGEPCKWALNTGPLLDLLRSADSTGGMVVDKAGAAVDRWAPYHDINGRVGDSSLFADNERRLLYECAMRSRNARGCAVELGTYRGGSARIVAEALNNKQVHVYEAFGIPAGQADMTSDHGAGDFAAGEPDVRRYLADLPNIAWHVGVFPDTFAETGEVAFAHLDCDTYAGTRAALERFVPRLAPGGIILVDDYDWKPTPGVTRAVDEAEKLFASTARVTRQEKKALVTRR